LKTDQSIRALSDLEVSLNSDSLMGIRVGMCVGGGIAAIEAPKVIRELRRRGAFVRVYATENALRFIGKDALEWASAQSVVCAATGLAEHIATEDMVLVLPATTDLIGKAAQGICPDACSTYIQSALGYGKQILFVPTMHDSLRESPAFKTNVATLLTFKGVEFISPRIEEGKWKSPAPESVALEVSYRFNRQNKLNQGRRHRRALVTLGGTLVRIDSARALSNFSTGTLGAKVVESLLESGTEVIALCALHTASLPECSGLRKIDAPLFEDFQTWLENEKNTEFLDGIFHLAAVSDFTTETKKNAKISSQEEHLKLSLQKLPKLIQLPSVKKIRFKLACKYTASNTQDEFAKATSLLNSLSLDSVYWNWGEGAFGVASAASGLLLSEGAKRRIEIATKNQAAKAMVNLFDKRDSE